MVEATSSSSAGMALFEPRPTQSIGKNVRPKSLMTLNASHSQTIFSSPQPDGAPFSPPPTASNGNSTLWHDSDRALISECELKKGSTTNNAKCTKDKRRPR